MRFGVPGDHMEPGINLSHELHLTLVLSDYEAVQIQLEPSEALDMAANLTRIAHMVESKTKEHLN